MGDRAVKIQVITPSRRAALPYFLVLSFSDFERPVSEFQEQVSNQANLVAVNERGSNFYFLYRQGRVNYEDPNYNIDMPIFTIHGNHDDPTREGSLEVVGIFHSMSFSLLCFVCRHFLQLICSVCQIW